MNAFFISRSNYTNVDWKFLKEYFWTEFENYIVQQCQRSLYGIESYGTKHKQKSAKTSFLSRTEYSV